MNTTAFPAIGYLDELRDRKLAIEQEGRCMSLLRSICCLGRDF